MNIKKLEAFLFTGAPRQRVPRWIWSLTLACYLPECLYSVALRRITSAPRQRVSFPLALLKNKIIYVILPPILPLCPLALRIFCRFPSLISLALSRVIMTRLSFLFTGVPRQRALHWSLSSTLACHLPECVYSVALRRIIVSKLRLNYGFLWVLFPYKSMVYIMCLHICQNSLLIVATTDIIRLRIYSVYKHQLEEFTYVY